MVLIFWDALVIKVPLGMPYLMIIEIIPFRIKKSVKARDEARIKNIAALSGLACILMMSKIYTLPAVPDWNSWRTPASFFSSALVLGGLTAGLVIGSLDAPVLILLGAAFVFNLIFAPRFGLAGRRATPLGFRPNPAWPARRTSSTGRSTRTT